MRGHALVPGLLPCFPAALTRPRGDDRAAPAPPPPA